MEPLTLRKTYSRTGVKSSFEVSVPSYVKTVGGFVEFKIIVKYLEGQKQLWEIYRRFSDF